MLNIFNNGDFLVLENKLRNDKKHCKLSKKAVAQVKNEVFYTLIKSK